MLRLSASYDGKLWHFPLPRTAAVLGSSDESELVLPVPGVSRRHVRVERLETGGVALVDLGSRNGIRIGGERVERAELRPGADVRLGKASVCVEDVPSAEVDVAMLLKRVHDRVPARPPAQAVRDSSTGDVDGATTAEVSPSVALHLIRQIERQGLQAARASGSELFEEARRVLEAEWMAIVKPPSQENGKEPVGSEMALLAVTGVLPSEAELARLKPFLTVRRNETDPSSDTLLVRSSPDRGLLLVAARNQGEARLRSWQLDFFDFLADKLIACGEEAPPTRTAARPEPALRLPDGFVAGPSQAMKQLLSSIHATVHSSLDVLLLGETGSGKEMIARLVHDSGPTAKGPFVAINCAAIPTELLEAELFGVEARVATGVDPRPGLFVRAEKGTLFLDEIGDMSDPMQAKLLRALQEREVLPIGAHRPRKISVRVISASNKPLGELVRAGRFRADLFYRLRGLQFHLPPLRERKDDIPALVAQFANAASELYGKRTTGISRRVIELLAQHDWPGNVRELRNEVERAVLLAEEYACLEERHFGPIRWQVSHAATPDSAPASIHPPGFEIPAAAAGLGHAPPALPADREGATLASRVDELERELIQDALATTGRNKSKAARILGITRNGLALKLKRLGLD